MVEANRRLQETTDRAQRAAIVLARQRAIKEGKRQFQKQGLKPQHIARKVIVVAADEYLAEHRAELISEATEIVERLTLLRFLVVALSADGSRPNPINGLR